MTDTFEIRRLEPDDREAVHALQARCFSEAMALDELVLENLMTHPHGINLVAEQDEAIVGYAGAIHGARPKARLLTIHVDPAARRQGIAHALMDRLEEQLVARKAKVLELEVHATNEPAQRLYQQRGFDLAREDPNRYPALDDPRGYVMVKQLDPGP